MSEALPCVFDFVFRCVRPCFVVWLDCFWNKRCLYMSSNGIEIHQMGNFVAYGL